MENNRYPFAEREDEEEDEQSLTRPLLQPNCHNIKPKDYSNSKLAIIKEKISTFFKKGFDFLEISLHNIYEQVSVHSSVAVSKKS
jgi:hypothetical protein